MGNIQSVEDLNTLLTRYDRVSGTHNVILTFLISQFASQHIVSRIAKRSHQQFITDTLRSAMAKVTNMQQGNLGSLLKLNTGSLAEGLNLPQLFYVTEEGITGTEVADHDMLMVDDVFVDASLGECATNKGEFYLDTSETYPGFARARALDTNGHHKNYLVKRIENGEEVYYLSKFMIQQLREDKSMSGPAITKEFTIETNVESEIMKSNTVIPGESSADMVYAVNVTEWPGFMRDWKSRQKGTTSLDVIIQLTFGCFLVGAAHRRSKDPEIEWRISCSVPELYLAHTLTVVQRQVYMTFKFLVKETIKGQKGIMTYHLKTTLLWTKENSSPNLWREDNLSQCLYLLLDTFINFLAQKKLPNYFIPASNLFDHLSDDHIRTTLHAMVKLREDPLCHLLKFQKGVRLLGQSTWWEHSFELILSPPLKTASEVLKNYQTHPKSSTILLKQCFFDSMISVTVCRLAEAKIEDVYQTMMNYLSLSAVLKCAYQVGLPFAEQVYNFIVHLCRQCFLETSNLDIIFTFLKYARRQIEEKNNLDLNKKLTLLEACWNHILAKCTDDPDMVEIHLDQCAVVFDAFDLEENDVITVTEYSCFVYQLWSKRFGQTTAESQMMQTGNCVQVLRTLIMPLADNYAKEDYQFHGIWKLLQNNIDHVEPNLTVFLESTNLCCVPHEVIALWINILTIQQILVPSVESILKLTRNECSCPESAQLDGSCRPIHEKLIAAFQDFPQSAGKLAQSAAQFLYHLVMILNKGVTNLDFHVPGDRRKAKAASNFILALSMMYARQWDVAFSVLYSLESPSLPMTKVISKYVSISGLVVIYSHYNNLPQRKALIPVPSHNNIQMKQFSDKVKGEPSNQSGQSELTKRYFSKHLYNTKVDFSTYGKHLCVLNPNIVRVKNPDTDIDIEIRGSRVIIHQNGTPTTYTFEESSDIQDIMANHFHGHPEDINGMSQRELLAELTARTNSLDTEQIVEKMQSTCGTVPPVDS